ncbi:MAG: hypothetical protein E7562_06360 [Ruminococcaceae bacterium]|nr:hypothetical protein [Oscillospiraceae bacterium]
MLFHFFNVAFIFFNMEAIIMQFFIYSYISVLVLFFVIKVLFALKGRRMILRLFLHAVLGLGVLILINLTSKFSGVYIPINGWSVGFTAAFGLPSVCAQLLIQIFFL